jgi:hypothetical protein
MKSNNGIILVIGICAIALIGVVFFANKDHSQSQTTNAPSSKLTLPNTTTQTIITITSTKTLQPTFKPLVTKNDGMHDYYVKQADYYQERADYYRKLANTYKDQANEASQNMQYYPAKDRYNPNAPIPYYYYERKYQEAERNYREAMSNYMDNQAQADNYRQLALK